MDKKKKILALVAVVLVGGLVALSSTGGIGNLKSSAIEQESPQNQSDEEIKAAIAQYDAQISAAERNKSGALNAANTSQERAQAASREWKKAESACLPILGEKDKEKALQTELNDLWKERGAINRIITSLTGKDQLNNMTISSNNAKIATLKNKLKTLNKKSSEYASTNDEINRLENENKSVDINYQKKQLALYDDSIDPKTKKVTKKGKISLKQDAVNAQEFKVQQIGWSRICGPYTGNKISEQTNLTSYANWTEKAAQFEKDIQDLKNKQNELKKKLETNKNKDIVVKNDDELTSELLTKLTWDISALEEAINEMQLHISDFEACETDECKNNFYTWWVEYKPHAVELRETLKEFFVNAFVPKTYADDRFPTPQEMKDAYDEAQDELNKARDAYNKAKEKSEHEKRRLEMACEDWELPECNILCTEGEAGRTIHVKKLSDCHYSTANCYDKWNDYLNNWHNHLSEWIVATNLSSCLDFCKAKKEEWATVGNECIDLNENLKFVEEIGSMYNECVTSCNDKYYTPPATEENN